MDQPSKSSKIKKIQKEAEKKEVIIKEDPTKITRYKSAIIKTNLDKLGQVAAHMG